MITKHFSAIFACIGLLVPIAFLIFGRPLAPNWIIYLWPSSIFLLGTSGHEKTIQAIIILCIAIGVNVGLYAGVGWIVGKIVNMARQ